MSSGSAYVALLRTVQALARRSDDNLWPELLNSAVRVVPGAEGGSILIRTRNSYQVVTGLGYPNELSLVGTRLPLDAAMAWYGDPEQWQRGEPRIIAGEELRKTIKRGAEIVGDSPISQVINAELTKLQANLCLPIVLDNELVAYINLDNRSDPAAFSPESVVIAQQYSLQVTALLAVKRERAELESRLREFETIANLSKALQSTLALDDIVQRLAHEVARLMDSPHLSIFLLNKATQQLENKIALGFFTNLRQVVIPKGIGVSWASLEQRQVLLIPNVEADPRIYDPRQGRPPTPHAQLTTPLFDSSGNALGVIHTTRNLPRSFSAQEIRLMEVIGSFAATAIERGIATTQLQRQLLESQSLLKTVAALASGDAQEMWQELLEAAVELVPGSEGGSLWLRQGNRFVVVAQQNFADVLLGQSFPEETFLLWSSNRQRWTSGEPSIRRKSFLQDSSDLPNYYDSPAQAELFRTAGRTEELQCTVSIPIKQGSQIIAHIDLDNFSDEQALNEHSIEVGRRFALQVSALLAAQRQNSEREAAYEGSLRAIGVALEARDLETAGHTDRVATLTVQLGQALGLCPEELRELRWGAYLHDMGKLMVPDTILLKPAKLTPEEFVVMKTHAYMGYQLSQNLPFLPESVRQVIHHHHERWDGSGYPAGLSGEEIPLLARIFSVSDVFDALISIRPYKAPWTVEQALEEIQCQSGKQFDPQVVQACIAIVGQTNPVVK